MGKANVGKNNAWLLLFAFISFSGFATAEMVGAYVAASLSLLADASTMIVDAATYALNAFAERRKKTASPIEVIRLELFSPLLSVTVLVGVSIYVVNDAFNQIKAAHEDVGDLPSSTSPSSASPLFGEAKSTNDKIMLVFAGINLLLDIANIVVFAVYGNLSGNKEESPSVENNESALEEGDVSTLSTSTSQADETGGEQSTVDSKPSKGLVNMNMCSAYTHVIADTLRSLAVLVAALLSILDPAIQPELADAWAAIVVSIVIFLSLYPLIRGLWEKVGELKEAQRLDKLGQLEQPLLSQNQAQNGEGGGVEV